MFFNFSISKKKKWPILCPETSPLQKILYILFEHYLGTTNPQKTKLDKIFFSFFTGLFAG